MFKKLLLLPILLALFTGVKAQTDTPLPTSGLTPASAPTWYRHINGSDTSYYLYTGGKGINIVGRRWLSSNFIKNQTTPQTANFNIAGTGAIRRATIDTLISRSSRTIVLRDTLQTNRPVHFFDSVGAFRQLGNLFKTQALKIYGNVELYSNAIGTLGRDLDFVKSRAGGPPVIGDEYGYINWRAPDSTGNALPAVQMIGRVAGHVGTNYNLGNLEFKVRSSAAYPGNTLLELTHDQRVNVEGNLRVGMGATGFTDFDSQAGLINGNLGLFGNNTDRSVDFVKQVAGGLAIGTTMGGIDGYGKTTAAGLQRMSFIKTFAGDNTTASVLTGKIKFAVQNISGVIDTALTMDDNANVNVKHDLNVATAIKFNTNSGILQFGQNVSTNPYIVADASDNLYLGTNNGAALQVTAGKNVKINQLTGAGTEMVTISTDGTLGRTAIPTGGGSGSVTTVGVASSNGFAGTSNGDANNPTLTLTSTLNTPILASNGTALIAATTTGSGTTAVLNNDPTITGTNSVLTLAATGSSNYTTYKSATSTTRGIIGNGSSVLTGASDSDFIIRSEGALKFANGNSKSAEVTTSGVGVPTNSSFYFGTASDEYITSDGSSVTIGVNNSGVVNVSASGVAVTGGISTTGLDNYDTDLSGSYTSRSKVDKDYVDAAVTAGGGNRPYVVTSSSISINAKTDYFFNGVSAIWTAPLPASFPGDANRITIKNRGSGSLSVNSNAGGTDFFGGSAGVSISLPSGGTSVTLISDGTYWNVE